ncbi:MAG: hypothetical protein R2845_07965 [Thermomicrobiales bacterium]
MATFDASPNRLFRSVLTRQPWRIQLRLGDVPATIMRYRNNPRLRLTDSSHWNVMESMEPDFGSTLPFNEHRVYAARDIPAEERNGVV